jgi:hypothetical protein
MSAKLSIVFIQGLLRLWLEFEGDEELRIPGIQNFNFGSIPAFGSSFRLELRILFPWRMGGIRFNSAETTPVFLVSILNAHKTL